MGTGTQNTYRRPDRFATSRSKTRVLCVDRPVSPWAYFRADWKAVLWRIYKKMNDNRLLAVAAGVVFYGLLALFPAVTAFVSFYGLVADPSTIHEHLSLAAGILPQGALDILNEQLTRLTAHRTSALSLGFIGGLLFALWSANAGSKAIMDGLNVAYGETEKRSFVQLNLVALAFTLGAIFAFMLAISAVVLAPIVLSHLGLGGARRCAGPHCALAGSDGARRSRIDDAISVRSQPERSTVDLAFPRQRPGCRRVARGLSAFLMVHRQFRQLRRDLWLVGRGDRHDDVDVDLYDRCASRSRTQRRARSSCFVQRPCSRLRMERAKPTGAIRDERRPTIAFAPEGHERLITIRPVRHRPAIRRCVFPRAG